MCIKNIYQKCFEFDWRHSNLKEFSEENGY